MTVIEELEALIAATKPSRLRFQTVRRGVPSQELVVHEVAQRAIDAIRANEPKPKTIRAPRLAEGDRVMLTFKEAEGATGVVAEIGCKGYDYADVRLDVDGTRTGPLPLTCVMKLERHCVVCDVVITDMSEAVQIQLDVEGASPVFAMRHKRCEMDERTRMRLAIEGRQRREEGA